MRRVNVLLTALALLATMFAVAPAQGQESPELAVPDDAVDGIVSEKAESVYIVMFEDDPVITYDGDIAGLPATKPKNGKLNPNSAQVRKYQKFLTDKHDNALSDAGVDSKIYSYTISFNGVAAKMTGIEATALAKQDGVLTVWKDEIRQLDTDRSPEDLDMPALWDAGRGPGRRGRHHRCHRHRNRSGQPFVLGSGGQRRPHREGQGQCLEERRVRPTTVILERYLPIR